MEVLYGTPNEINSWMKLVYNVSPVFPGLETEEALKEHKNTVLEFMNKRQALCVKINGEIEGVILFSVKHNMICFLAVSPAHRKEGVASALLAAAQERLDKSRDITVTTFREDDEKSIAARSLYKKFGYEEDILVEEFGYPGQLFVLHPKS